MTECLANGCLHPEGHCWHRAHYGTSTAMMFGNSGTEQMTCCRCGRPGERTWRERSMPIEGHGPHVSETKREYGEAYTQDQRPEPRSLTP